MQGGLSPNKQRERDTQSEMERIGRKTQKCSECGREADRERDE